MSARRRGRSTGLAVTGLLVLAACGSPSATPVPSVTAAGVAPTVQEPMAEPSPTPSSTTDAPAGTDASEATVDPVGQSGTPAGTDGPTSDDATTSGDATSDDGATGEDAAEASDPAPDASDPPGSAPSPTDIARLVADEVVAAGDAAQHVVTDLDDDGTPEVVVAGVVEDRARVGVWWWDPGVGFGDAVRLDAGPGRAVVEVRAADVTRDGVTELLVRIGGGARDSLALWSVRGPGDVRPLEAEGGCFAGSHVFGATSARLQSRGDDPPAILATCDDTPLPVADWSTAVYEFSDGAYRFVPASIDTPDDDATAPDEPTEGAVPGRTLGSRDAGEPVDR